MSSKTTKKSSSTASSGAQKRSSASRSSATPQGAAGSTASGSHGNPPVSPTRFSRLHEKEELANLNDRLAAYIDRVRHLETENNRLTLEVRTSEEIKTSEVTNVKTIYEKELTDMRKLIDDLSKQKARLEIDNKKNYESYLEAHNNEDKKIKECNALQASLNLAESKLNDLTGKYNQVVADKKRLMEEKKALEKSEAKLSAQVAQLKDKVAQETLTRVSAEDSLMTLKEELSFKEQLYQQQLTECRTKKHVEISEIDGRLNEAFEERYYESLQEIREQYEIDLENKNEEVKKLYEDKIRSLEGQMSRNSNATAMAMDEVRQMSKRLEEANMKLAGLEAERNMANQRARDLEKQYETSKANYMEEFSRQNFETTKLREEISSMVREYQDLMDIKVALDLEIAAYRKLLEGEEERLNLTPGHSPSRRPTPRSFSRAKRKRETFEEVEGSSSRDVVVNSSSNGDVEIIDSCPDGKFVKLFNKGTKEISLSGWQIIRKAGDVMTHFKFHRSVKIDPGANVTIWSSDENQSHDPPSSIVMKGQRWVVALNMTTTLLDSEGSEAASVEHKVQQSSSTFSRLREGGGLYKRRMDSSQFHADGIQGNGDERCSLM